MELLWCTTKLETDNWGFSQQPAVLIFLFYVEDNGKGERTNGQKRLFPAVSQVQISALMPQLLSCPPAPLPH